MIVYVDMEHNRLRGENPELWQHFAAQTLRTKYRLEAISGELCLIIHYTRLSQTTLQSLNVQAIIVGGHYTALPHYGETTLAGIRSIFRKGAYPTLGICGGHQLMAHTCGVEFGPIAPVANNNGMFPNTPLPIDAPDMSTESHQPSTCEERGFMPVRLTKPHPLTAGFSQDPVFYQLHSWEVKSLPQEFDCLAESDVCPLQIIAHKTAPLYGVQFHPEQYDDNYPDGRQILENFFKLATILS